MDIDASKDSFNSASSPVESFDFHEENAIEDSQQKYYSAPFLPNVKFSAVDSSVDAETASLATQQSAPLYHWSKLKPFFVALALGQLISVCSSGSAVFSELLVRNYNAKFPFFQSFFAYSIITVVCSAWLIYDGLYLAVFKQRRWWIYLVIAIFDVYGNYFTVLAFQHTNMVSVMLLDCFVLPVVMILSYFVLRVKYHWVHLIGVFLCISGVVILLLNDLFNNPQSDSVLGDMLTLVGATFYGCSNVGQELMVKNFRQREFLAMVGTFGCIITLIQFLAMELPAIRNTPWDGPAIAYLVGFTLCLVSIYTLGPVLIKMTSATMYNLGFLTADFYVLILSIILFHYPLHWLFFGAYFVILMGIVVYNLKSPKESTRENCRCFDHLIEKLESYSKGFPVTTGALKDEEIGGIKSESDQDALIFDYEEISNA